MAHLPERQSLHRRAYPRRWRYLWRAPASPLLPAANRGHRLFQSLWQSAIVLGRGGHSSRAPIDAATIHAAVVSQVFEGEVEQLHETSSHAVYLHKTESIHWVGEGRAFAYPGCFGQALRTSDDVRSEKRRAPACRLCADDDCLRYVEAGKRRQRSCLPAFMPSTLHIKPVPPRFDNR